MRRSRSMARRQRWWQPSGPSTASTADRRRTRLSQPSASSNSIATCPEGAHRPLLVVIGRPVCPAMLLSVFRDHRDDPRKRGSLRSLVPAAVCSAQGRGHARRSRTRRRDRCASPASFTRCASDGRVLPGQACPPAFLHRAGPQRRRDQRAAAGTGRSGAIAAAATFPARAPSRLGHHDRPMSCASSIANAAAHRERPLAQPPSSMRRGRQGHLCPRRPRHKGRC